MFTMRSVIDPQHEPAACPHAVFPSALGVRSFGRVGALAWLTFSLDSIDIQPPDLVAKHP